MADKYRQQRYSGVLLHPTSLPGNTGIGDIGVPAFKFVDFLHESLQTIWQILPLGPVGYGNSPYQSYSAFAGNSLLISLDNLAELGLLTQWEIDSLPKPDNPHRIDFDYVKLEKGILLKKAMNNFMDKADKSLQKEYRKFQSENKWWLDDYSLFMALLDEYDFALWSDWPEEFRDRKPEALENYTSRQSKKIERFRIEQFFFFRQWKALKDYANEKGIRILGDIPIFVAENSADVWVNPDEYFLDEKGKPTVIAGVPPDYFSKNGQRWGNPLYRWSTMRMKHYNWWIKRLKMSLEIVDLIRIDHFRGFAAYWEVPAKEKTAKNGRWIKGPGKHFFNAVEKKLGHLPLVAEDLGVITKSVVELRDEYCLPGMKVMHFAFGDTAHNPYLPHNHRLNSVIYSGTHDNDTTIGWYKQTDAKTKDHVRRYFSCSDDQAPYMILRAVWQSPAKYAIVPMQDVLHKDSWARLNTPGTDKNNWVWRFEWEELSSHYAESLSYHTALFGRIPEKITDKIDDNTPDPEKAIEL